MTFDEVVHLMLNENVGITIAAVVFVAIVLVAGRRRKK